MIKKQDFINWYSEDNSCSLYMFAMAFDIKRKKDYINFGFDLENNIPDKKKISTLLGNLIEKFIDFEFTADLKSCRFGWYPDWMKNEYKNSFEVENYLNKNTSDKFITNNYRYRFKVNNIQKFLEVFIDYAQKYSYQDIQLYSRKKNIILNICHHNTFWIVGADKYEIKKLSNKFKSDNWVIREDNNLQKVKIKNCS